ncbi:MAG: DNA-directed RNA polymerase subunit RpoH/Rpb5 C-terminal domain-containing protein [Nanoarchaeota archaeon]
MHTLQPKITKMSEKEIEKLLEEFNISKSQLPSIFLKDPGVPKDCKKGDVLKIERKNKDKVNLYFRVVL